MVQDFVHQQYVSFREGTYFSRAKFYVVNFHSHNCQARKEIEAQEAKEVRKAYWETTV